MRIDEFWHGLRTEGRYETDLREYSSLYRRLVGWSGVFYYLDIIHVIVSAKRITLRGGFDRRQWAIHSLRMLQAAERFGGKACFSGFENAGRAHLPVVYVANHMSMMETLVLPGALLAFGDVATVAKESLLNYPLYGCVMKAVEPISVKRHDAREDLKTVLTQGEQFLRHGRSVLVFPQSTREADFQPRSFNSLGTKLARKAGVDVIPVALRTDFHGIGRRVRDCGPISRDKPIRFKMGAPVSVTGSGKEAQEAVLAFICESLRSWGVTIKPPPPRGAVGPGDDSGKEMPS